MDKSVNVKGQKQRKLVLSLLLACVMMLALPILAMAAVPASAPSNIHTTYVGGSSVTIAWDKVTDATSYKVYVDGTLKKTVGDVSSTTISGLTTETAYAITMKASNADGDSSASSAVNFTTTNASLNLSFDMSSMFSYAQMIIDCLMPVIYITLGIALGFIVIRALKSAFS